MDPTDGEDSFADLDPRNERVSSTPNIATIMGTQTANGSTSLGSRACSNRPINAHCGKPCRLGKGLCESLLEDYARVRGFDVGPK